eukprot:TRINITY_DN5844_c1_g1_i1.p4 TRINITY_DN5844_c1_g1~~TRINITY_DN5844_c1_g1_i1.p4  ORF type:complete len:186 (+),score=77.24 TRINITY_DN5844_c1_g1_i1:80-559(+)
MGEQRLVRLRGCADCLDDAAVERLLERLGLQADLAEGVVWGVRRERCSGGTAGSADGELAFSGTGWLLFRSHRAAAAFCEADAAGCRAAEGAAANGGAALLCDLVAADSARRAASGACNRCGAEGHFANECTSRPGRSRPWWWYCLQKAAEKRRRLEGS